MEDEAIARWRVRIDAEIALKDAKQEFINLLIQQTYDAGAFYNCPDRDNLYNIVDLALRLALTCHKQEGKGPVNGYGIASAFTKAVRYHKDQFENERLANARYAKRMKSEAAKAARAKKRSAPINVPI